jgi:hypothetical protein
VNTPMVDQNREIDGGASSIQPPKDAVPKAGSWKFTAIALFCCFTTGLLLCWRSNFSHAALDVASMFDSGKYISSTELVINATSFIHHFTNQEWRTICSALKEPLMMDGPILPLLGAAWFTLIHKSPDLYDMRAALALQALLHGASACCMFFAARRILNNSRWALFAGLLWAAYPSAVLGAGRFMTENITSTLLLLMVCVVPKQATEKYFRSFVLGFIAAAVGLLKAALLPGILVGLLVAGASIWRNSSVDIRLLAKRMILHSVSLALGALIILAPWLFFTKEATGNYSITAQREPVLNIVIGGNSETDGWSGNPETDFVKLFDTVNGDKAGTFLGIWQANLPKLSNIAIRRVTRLWSSPWNDCLSKFMGLTLPAQWFWHQLILYLAVFGTLLVAFHKSARSSHVVNPLICLSGSILAAHFVYVVFNASPRQAFTSMPFLVLLTCCSLYQIARSNNATRAAMYIAVSMIFWLVTASIDLHSTLEIIHAESAAYLISWLIYCIAAALGSCAIVAINEDRKTFFPSFLAQVVPAAVICAAFASTANISPEWQCDLKPGLQINRTVSLRPDLKPDWAVLIVDGDYGLTKASVEINGTKLTEPLTSLFTLTSDKNPMVNYAVFGGVSNKNPEQLRQWRAAVVPLSLLKPQENKISIQSKSGDATVYGSFNRTQDGKLMTPTMWGFSGCKLLSETQPKLEARYTEPLTASAVKGKSWLSYKNVDTPNDLSPSFGVQTGQYRVFLCLGFNKTKNKEVAAPQVLQTIALETDAIEISEHKPFSKQYPIPKNLGNSTYVNIAVSGTLSGTDDVHVLSKIDVRNLTSLGSDLCVPGSVKLIQSKDFILAGDLTTASLNQENEFFEIKLQSHKPINLSKLSLKLTPRERPDFAKSKVAIY